MGEHDELCKRAKRWLRGTRRCNPVFSNIASCGEIPDAIGWSSVHQWYGSTVVECKTSIGDFYADQKKRFMWQSPVREDYPGKSWKFSRGRLTIKEAKEGGYSLIEVPIMGDFRFYLCKPDVIPLALAEEKAPCHGLIYCEGNAMRIIKPAPRREKVDKNSEIRYLRFAIINSKEPYATQEIVQQEMEVPA